MKRPISLRHASNMRLLLRELPSAARALGKPKLFCIGRNKTGTTSLAKALRELGLIVGNQWLAEHLLAEGMLEDWARRDFRRLFGYCHTAQAFQDAPFSWPLTFQALDQKFPRSKFILTVRHTPEEWYDSLTRFHAKVFGDGSIPQLQDLLSAQYVRPGYAHKVNRTLYNTPEDNPYRKETLIASYQSHNDHVQEYFRHRANDLLVLNVAEPGAYDRLCQFLDKPYAGQTFPWENKTADLKKHP